MTCIAYRNKADTNEVMGMKHETKGNNSRRGSCLLNITYYKLQARKHFSYYIIGQGIESYRFGGACKIFNQALVLPRAHCIQKTMGKKPKIMAQTGLCSSQRRSSTMTDAMKSALPDAVQDVVQANHWDGAFGVDESRCMLHSQLKAL